MKTYIMQISKRIEVKAINRASAIADLKADMYATPITQDFEVSVVQEIEQEPEDEEPLTEDEKDSLRIKEGD